jgi:hypothetical protein
VQRIRVLLAPVRLYAFVPVEPFPAAAAPRGAFDGQILVTLKLDRLDITQGMELPVLDRTTIASWYLTWVRGLLLCNRAFNQTCSGAQIIASHTFSVVAAGPTKLALTSSAFSVSVAQCSAAITVQTQNASGIATNPISNTTVNLSSMSVGGAFFGNAACITAFPA